MNSVSLFWMKLKLLAKDLLGFFKGEYLYFCPPPAKTIFFFILSPGEHLYSTVLFISLRGWKISSPYSSPFFVWFFFWDRCWLILGHFEWSFIFLKVHSIFIITLHFVGFKTASEDALISELKKWKEDRRSLNSIFTLNENGFLVTTKFSFAPGEIGNFLIKIKIGASNSLEKAKMEEQREPADFEN